MALFPSDFCPVFTKTFSGPRSLALSAASEAAGYISAAKSWVISNFPRPELLLLSQKTIGQPHGPLTSYLVADSRGVCLGGGVASTSS